jgi:glycosyltransferase involved in cell wall biosynthesis
MTFFNFSIKGILVAMTRKYDLVFATSTPLTAGIPGVFAKIFRRKKFIFEVRDLWPELPRAMGVIKNPLVLSAMSFLEWLSYRAADRCIGLSPGIVDGIKSKGVLATKVIMIPNGCDFDLFSTEKNALRPQGISDSDLLIIFTGTHGVANGLDALIDTAIVLKTKGLDHIKFLLVGDGKLKKDLIARVKKENLENVFFMDPVAKTKLAGLVKSADLGAQVLANVSAFYYGTSPNKFFDYISAGLPVVNNYPGWVADMLIETNSGIVVAPDDPNAFADKLERLAHNKNELLVMGKNAKALALEKFDRKKLANQWVNWLKETHYD